MKHARAHSELAAARHAVPKHFQPGMFDMAKVEEAVDPSRFRVAYRGAKVPARLFRQAALWICVDLRGSVWV